MASISERISGAIWGLLIGDALGIPYVGHSPTNLPSLNSLEFGPSPDFARSYKDILPGTWSDDGAQALCLLESLLQMEEFDPKDFARLLLMWSEDGHNAVDEKVFEIGQTTCKALLELKKGRAALECGQTDEHSNGNGSLMRALPLALWHKGKDLELIKDAHLQSKVTHAHIHSQVCCAIYCMWVRKLLKDSVEPWKEALSTIASVYQTDNFSPDYTDALNFILKYNVPPSGTGYVIDCLLSAKWAYDEGEDFESVLKSAISLGNDTDTTAAVAGGLAGAKYGFSSIPKNWRSNLRGQNIAKPFIAKLLEHSVITHSY